MTAIMTTSLDGDAGTTPGMVTEDGCHYGGRRSMTMSDNTIHLRLKTAYLSFGSKSRSAQEHAGAIQSKE